MIIALLTMKLTIKEQSIMSKEMLGCPHCNSAYLGDSSHQHNCPSCSRDLVRLNISETAWDALSDVDKENHKRRVFENLNHSDVINQSMAANLQRLSDDVHVIRNIMVGFVILWAIGLVIGFIAALTN